MDYLSLLQVEELKKVGFSVTITKGAEDMGYECQ